MELSSETILAGFGIAGTVIAALWHQNQKLHEGRRQDALDFARGVDKLRDALTRAIDALNRQ